RPRPARRWIVRTGRSKSLRIQANMKSPVWTSAVTCSSALLLINNRAGMGQKKNRPGATWREKCTAGAQDPRRTDAPGGACASAAVSCRQVSAPGGAGRVAQNGRPTLQRRRARRPAFVQAPPQELIGRRLVRPDGDRRQLPHSGDAEVQPAAAGFELDQEVVLELVHADHVDLGAGEAARFHPVEDAGDARKCGDLV